MSNKFNLRGSGVPPAWSVLAAVSNKGVLPDRGIQKDLFANRLLVGPGSSMNAADWTVRDQGTRGTCNAFAIVAAEELVETNQRGAMPDLSEEYLYAHLRQNIFSPLDGAEVNLDAIDQDEIEASGATFLISGPTALHKHGVCEERFAIYDKAKQPVNYTLKPIPAAASENAVQRRRPLDTFEHDITKDPETGDGRFWANNGTGFAPSALFARKIQEGLPVVASFAILSSPGDQAWTGRRAVRWGIVSYPSDAEAALLEPIGGHTVCLIGVFEDNGAISAFAGVESPGYFLFRNSHGTDRFARKTSADGLTLGMPAPGYGVISARDVDRYCWEYLTRRDAADGLPKQ